MAVEYKERRRFPHFVCDTGVRVHPEIGQAGYWGTVGDISLGGCYIFTFSPLPAGQVVALDIKAGDKEIHVAGKTVSSHPGVGMGVAFNGFTAEDSEERLKGYVQNWPASQRKNRSRSSTRLLLRSSLTAMQSRPRSVLRPQSQSTRPPGASLSTDVHPVFPYMLHWLVLRQAAPGPRLSPAKRASRSHKQAHPVFRRHNKASSARMPMRQSRSDVPTAVAARF